MEAKLFTGDTPHVSTFEFHEHRERAPHWDQPTHRPRLERAANFVHRAATFLWDMHGILPIRVVDLGCGDGGLLAQLKNWPSLISARGYDFQPSNEVGWAERGVDGTALDFVKHWDAVVATADVYVITECLEHLADPHGMVRRIHDRHSHIVASSPHTEHAGSHDECHAWAWDQEGYAKMLTDAGFKIEMHDTVGMFQVIWGRP